MQLEDTETYFSVQARKGSRLLLERLIVVHGGDIAAPEEPAVVDPEPSEPEQPTKKYWFSVEPDGQGPKISDILVATSRHYEVSKLDLLSARRTMDIVRPRQVCYYLARHLTKRSLPEIGRRIGGRDHTSALHGIQKIEQLRRTDPKLNADLHVIATTLGWPLHD